METAMRLSKGTRRRIRNEKAAIRRQFGNSEEAEKKIKDFVNTFYTAVLPKADTSKKEAEREAKSDKSAKSDRGLTARSADADLAAKPSAKKRKARSPKSE
jgi:hypothetical protein